MTELNEKCGHRSCGNDTTACVSKVHARRALGAGGKGMKEAEREEDMKKLKK